MKSYNWLTLNVLLQMFIQFGSVLPVVIKLPNKTPWLPDDLDHFSTISRKLVVALVFMVNAEFLLGLKLDFWNLSVQQRKL